MFTHKYNATTPLASHIYGYDPAGRITTWQQAGQGLTAASWSYGHNADDELLSATKTADSAPNTPIDSENWSLDAAGNWLSHSRGSGAVMETRTHNSMSRLTAIGGNTVIEGSVNEFARVTVNNATAQLSKDPVGDGFRYRRTVPVTPGSNTVTVQATDTSNQTTTKQWQFSVPAASRTFSYDANGNTLSDGQRTMTWDVKNRLRTVTKGGTTWKWDYDHADRRVKEYENNTLTKVFVWSGTNIVQERNAANTTTRTHYSGGFSDGATPATGTKYQTLTDHLGHVREIVNASGTVVTRYDYTSYQGPVKVSGTLEATFQTIGRYYHHAGSGLELALYRAYDPELGRWMSEDPIGERGGLNFYRFGHNNPISELDLLGLVDLNLISKKEKAIVGRGRNNMPVYGGSVRAWFDRIRPKGLYSVAAHGSCNNPLIDNTDDAVTRADGHGGVPLEPEDLYKKMIDNGYQPGAPILLLACESGCGENAFAKRLAAYAKAPVGAPTACIETNRGKIMDDRGNPGYIKWFSPSGGEIRYRNKISPPAGIIPPSIDATPLRR